jgi:beta-lactamase class D
MSKKNLGSSIDDFLKKECIEYFAERAKRAHPAKIARILKRVGNGNAPVAGDEMPRQSLRPTISKKH